MTLSTVHEAPVAEQAADPPAYKAVNPDHPRLAIKHDALFLLTDTEGFMPGQTAEGFGLFRDDTRWLTRWELTLNDSPLLLLNSSTADGYGANFVYANNEPLDPELPKMSIMVNRDVVLNDGMTERVTVHNYGDKPAKISLKFAFGNDFADMFEVRGQNRPKRGQTLQPFVAGDRRRVTLSYLGLDKLLRESFLEFPKLRPTSLTGSCATFAFTLARHEERELLVHVGTRIGGGTAPEACHTTFTEERAIADSRYAGWREYNAAVSTSNAQFDAILRQAELDVYTLIQRSPQGRCLAAGVPWFAVPFGRDDFITALQTVAFMPDLTRDILRFFTKYQGTKHDEELAEEPGKMPHEIRTGEMANMKEIAFRPYYGTVDATQLWVMLLTEYVRWTGDLDLARELWPNLQAADGFLSASTDEGARFITYGGTGALSNQGWKDSGISIRYSNGGLAKGPIALCEAQGYLYSAWKGAAELARLLSFDDYAGELEARAARLKDRFEREFEMGDFIALAIDGEGTQCDVVSSNPGHLLGTGLISRDRELKIVDGLMSDTMFSGWGIRTLASTETAYQPMEYQLGSVWPHDTAFSASKFASLGRLDDADRVLRGLFDAAVALGDNRLPELFCGFARGTSKAPIRYPVACKPQAWAAGAWMQLVSGLLNVKADAVHNRVRFGRCNIPSWLGTVTVRGWRIADSTVDVEFSANQVRVLRVVGDIDVTVQS